MVFGNKEKKREELTMQEAIVELGKTMKTINSRLDKIEEQPKEVKPEEQEEPKEEKKLIVKKKIPNFMVYDQPIKTKRVIVDNTDKDNPQVYDIEAAIAKILNVMAELKVDLS